MVDFYLTFLGARVVNSSPRMSFLTYDYADHRLGIVQIPGLKNADPPKSNVGLAHTSFGFDSLEDLVTSYEQKKAHGIMPLWCVNHGMSTSMYYQDPDGNEVETQVDNFDTAEESMAYIESQAFTENPIGADFDPEVFVKRVKSGEDQKAIKKMPHIGSRISRMDKGTQPLATEV